MTTSTMTDPRVLLDEMRADIAAQPELYQPTEFWREASAQIAADLREAGFENFRRLPSIRKFFVPSYGPPGNMLSTADVAQIEELLLQSTPRNSKKHLALLSLLTGEAWALSDYRVFRAGDRPELKPDLSGITESTTGNPPDQNEFEGARFSRSMLNYLHGLVFLKQTLGDVGIRSVLEIGGGFGTLGEILHKSGDGYAYVDVDIPPTAAVASYYLSQIPGLDLIDYSATRALPTLAVPPPGTQMVLCPWQLPRLEGSVDLLWNFISFQEMEPATVKFYLAEARRLGARYVLLRNLREGKQRKKDAASVGVNEPILGADYDRFLAGYRLVATNVFPFGYRTIDGFHSELRLYEKRAGA